MNPEREIRKLLIAFCHSSLDAQNRLTAELSTPEFIALLVSIAVDAEDYGGDAPMQAAYYLSKADSSFTKPHEAALLPLLEADIGYGGHVALTLGKMRSVTAKPQIEAKLSEGEFPSAWLYKEALKAYG